MQQTQQQRPRLRVGIDAVCVQAMEESVATFGDRFLRRIFSAHELATANRSAQRLAARFAAKEAAIKAFDLSEAGVNWRDIELRSDEAGRPSLQMHGRALVAAGNFASGNIAVSLSHEGGMALAVVVALPA